MARSSIAVAFAGSGGSGAMTAGAVFLRAAGRAGYYGMMTELFGAQVRGGESAALVQISTELIQAQPDRYDLFVALDWDKVEQFVGEIPLDEASIIIADPNAGPVPLGVAKLKADVVPLPMSDPSASRLETALHGCRVNMFATGAVSALVGLPAADVQAAVETIFKGRGDALRATNVKNAVTGAAAATSLPLNIRLKPPVAAGRPARAVQRLWRPLQESNESSCSTYNQCAELPVYLTGPMKKACLLLIMLTFNGAGNALDRDQQRAKGLLEEACAGCHAVGRSGASPRAGAPPFRALGENKLYDEEFGQRLQDGLSSIHPDMPTFRFTRRDAAAVLDYLRIIQDRPKRDEKRRSE